MITKLHVRNWQGMTGSFDLAPMNILTGPNGSGKSAVIKAIQVALTGFTDLGKKPAAVLALASDKATEISIEDDAGNILTRKFERKGPGGSQAITLNGAPVKEADLVLPAGLSFPVEGIHPAEFLALSGDRRAAWLFGQVGGAVAMDPAELAPLTLKYFAAPMDPAELLEKMGEDMKSSKAELERCVANIQRMTGTASDLPAGTMLEWEEKLKTAQTDLAQAIAEKAKNDERGTLAASRMSNINHLRTQVEAGEKKIVETRARIDELGKQITPPPAGDQADRAAVEKIRAEQNAVVESYGAARARAVSLRERIKALTEKGECPTCGSPVECLQSAIDEWDLEASNAEADAETAQARSQELAAKISQAMKAIDASQRNKELTDRIKMDREALASYEKTMARLREDLKKAEASIGDGEAADPSILAARIEGATQRRDECQAALRKFQAHAALADNRSKAEQDRQRLAQHIANLKDAQKAVKAFRDEALEKMTEKVIPPFHAAASKAFGSPAFLRIVGDNGKPEVDFGIVVGSREVSFETLSGGEKTVLLAALVAALQTAKMGAPTLALLELAEADDNRLDAVAEACKAIGFRQVIAATCHPVDISSPKLGGWKVLDMAEARAAHLAQKEKVAA